MAWEENSRICLHTQLIAILSRIGVFIIFICGTGAIVHNTGSVLVVLNAAMLYDRKI